MRISVISSSFPHPKFPQSGAFVYNLVDAWAKSGDHIDVYALHSRVHFLLKRHKKRSKLQFDKNLNVKYVKHLSFGGKRFAGVDLPEINFKFSHRALRESILKNGGLDDDSVCLYGKFLLSGGRHVSEISRQYRVNSFADLGESRLTGRLTESQITMAKEVLSCLDGVVCVSPRLEREVIELGMDPSRVLMLPNAADTNLFFPTDSCSAREELDLPQDKKIVIFVGHFIERKGPDRVLAAVESLPENYCCVFIGDGPMLLKSSRILRKAQVPNSELNLWLNAADVFCLPTLAEGSCNAINEARVVGLPIVTSNIGDITDFPPSSEYYVVNPFSIPEIAEAVEAASTFGRMRYSQGAIDLAERAKRIRSWMSNLVKGPSNNWLTEGGVLVQ